MKIYLTIILGLFLITLVSAESIGTFKQNQNMQITNYCTTGDCSYANLTSVQAPDGVVNYVNTLMTKNGQNFNYTYMVTQIGTYTFNTCADPGGTVVCDSDTFEVTPSGFTNNIAFYIIWIIIAAGLIVLGYKVEDYWLIILGGFALVLFGLYVLFYGIVGMKDSVYTWGLGIITLMVGGYFGIRAGLEQVE